MSYRCLAAAARQSLPNGTIPQTAALMYLAARNLGTPILWLPALWWAWRTPRTLDHFEQLRKQHAAYPWRDVSLQMWQILAPLQSPDELISACGSIEE